MQKYRIAVTKLARGDIENVNDYIAYTLKSPKTAQKTVNGLRRAIAALREMPQKHELHADEELREIGIRQLYYKNYKIIYFVDEKAQTVYIARVLHMLVDSRTKLYETFHLTK